MAARPDVALQLSFLATETLVWQEGPAIGTGRFGHVVLAQRIPTAELLAVKQIFIQEECEQGNDTSSLCMQRVVPRAKIEREVEIVQSLQHPNIVQCLGCEQYGPIYRLFMEFVPAGSLSKLLKELGAFPESAARHLVRQLTEGVAYLHSVGIAHRDLKCANLLLTDDGTVKIADFGSATSANGFGATDERGDTDELETARSVREGLGSPYWMAPELVRAERGDDGWRKADVWGIGCVLVELVTAKPPWDHHSNPLTAMFHIASKDAIPSIPPTVSEAARSFLLFCFHKDPMTRPSAAELLTHPFLTGDTEGLNRWQHPSVTTAPEKSEEVISQDIPEQLAEEPNNSKTPSRSSSSASNSPASPRDSHQSSIVGEDDAAVYSSDDDNEIASSRGRVLDAEPSSISRRPSASVFSWRELGRVRALADYSAGDSNELSLREGQTLIVAGANEFGWWRGRHVVDDNAVEGSPDVGWFPCTYVEWISSAEPFPVLRPHGEGEDLALSMGDSVLVERCEWRDDRLLAFGTTLLDRRQGWFPFSCLVDDSG